MKWVSIGLFVGLLAFCSIMINVQTNQRLELKDKSQSKIEQIVKLYEIRLEAAELVVESEKEEVRFREDRLICYQRLHQFNAESNFNYQEAVHLCQKSLNRLKLSQNNVEDIKMQINLIKLGLVKFDSLKLNLEARR